MDSEEAESGQGFMTSEGMLISHKFTSSGLKYIHCYVRFVVNTDKIDFIEAHDKFK